MARQPIHEPKCFVVDAVSVRSETICLLVDTAASDLDKQPSFQSISSFGRMMNELHELTAGFYLLAERRGWRPDNLPAFEH